MQDGRCFTSYIPNCTLNKNIQNRNNIKTDHQYRQFIQKNGDNLIDNLADVCYTREDAVCNYCEIPTYQDVKELVDTAPDPYPGVVTRGPIYMSVTK